MPLLEAWAPSRWPRSRSSSSRWRSLCRPAAESTGAARWIDATTPRPAIPAPPRSSACPALPAPTGAVIDVGPADASRLGEIVRDAPAGSTIRLADGTYPVREQGNWDRRLIFRAPGVTLRSASGDATRVVIDGEYDTGALVHVFADDVTIAEVTLMRARDHLLHTYPDDGTDVRGLRLYGISLLDAGEQFVKINSNETHTAWVDDGTVKCSRFTMTATGRENIERAYGCYTGGIDAHGARGWIVRANEFEGIYCEDGEVAEHAIHFWNGSRDTLVENNWIRNVSRGIGFGLVESGESRTYADDPYPGRYVGHYDGIIRNNVIVADIPQYDTGIELAQARMPYVHHNTVIETAEATNAFSSIDYRFANTLVDLRNNLTHRITMRDGAEATLGNNVEAVPRSWFVDAVEGDAHLRATASGAIDEGVTNANAGLDLDGEDHTYGPPDIGADEYRP